jgi:hypothetical protein
MSRAHFRGDLAKRSLHEILYTIQLHDVPGVLQATRGSVVKRLYVRDRTLIHASSSERSESLGRFLVGQGGVSEDSMTELRRRVGGRKRLGGELISERLLSPAEVKRALQGQIESLLWPLFSWTEGKIAFAVGEFEDPVPPTVHIPIRRLIKEACRRHPRPLDLISKLGPECLLAPVDSNPDVLLEIELDADEFELLSMINGEKTVRDLCQTGPLSPAENGKLVYAFGALRLVAPRSEEDLLEDALEIQQDWIRGWERDQETGSGSKGPFRWTMGPPSMGRLE